MLSDQISNFLVTEPGYRQELNLLKRFHLVTGIINVAGFATFFGGVPLAGVNEPIAATLTFLGFLAIVATPLVQISKAPVAGEQPPAKEPEPAVSDEPR
ncbi:MAG: hypothetical protein K9G08_03425 [Pontimonas sp.]|nr:hypothetical protein [Pontimonas sp.]